MADENKAFKNVRRDPETGGIIRPPPGGFQGGGAGGGGTPTQQQAVEQTTPTNVVRDNQGRPITFTAEGKTFFKTTSGERFDTKTLERIETRQSRTQQPQSRIVTSKQPIFRPGSESPQSMLPEQQTKIVKQDLPMSQIKEDVFRPESTNIFRPMSFGKAGGFSKAPQQKEEKIKFLGIRDPVAEDIRRIERETGKEVKGGSPLGVSVFSTRGAVSSLGVLSKTKVGGKVISKAQSLGTKGVNLANQALTNIGGGQILSKGKAATKATGKAIKTIKSTKLGSFASDLGFTTAKGVGIVEASKLTGKTTLSKEQKEAIKGTDFNKIVAAGFEKEREVLADSGGFNIPLTSRTISFKSIANEITPLAGSLFAKGSFEEGAKAQAQAQGITGEQLDLVTGAARRQKKFQGTGETIALLEISRSAESIGRKGVTKAFEKAAKTGVTIPTKQAFGKLFKISAPPIAKAGAIEGFSQEISQQVARGRPTSLKEASLMGGVGAATAGLIGGTIVGSKVTSPAVSKTIELGTFISDPFEKPGDLLQDLTEATTRRLTGKAAARPIISKSVSPTEVFTLSSSKQTPTPKRPIFSFGTPISVISESKKPIKTPSTIVSQSSILTPTQETSKTKIKTLDDVFKPSPLPISPFSITPTPAQTPVPVDSIVPPLNVNLPSFESTPVNVPVSTSLNTFVNIPTRTPLLKVPPPLPIAIPFNLGGSGAVVGKRKRFVNEIAAGQALFRKLTGGGTQPRSKPQKKSKGKRR